VSVFCQVAGSSSVGKFSSPRHYKEHHYTSSGH